MEPTKEKFKADLNLLDKALTTLEDALNKPLNDIVRDAAIQRFEYVFELSWKTAQAAAAYSGKRCTSPRDCIRLAYEMDWIENTEGWFEALEARNQTSHTYNEKLAQEVFNVAKKLPNLVRSLISHLKKIE